MGLFQGVRYSLASSLPPQRQEQLEYALSKNGAIKADNIASASHIITNSPHFEDSTSVQEGVAVVSDYWVDRSLVLGKIQSSQYYSVDPAMIFSGIVACAAELPTHDLEVLSAGVTALGGQWRTGLTNDVTHLFAVSKNSHKYATAIEHCESTGIKILLPHWFDDSVRLGLRNLTVDPYLWPDPPLLRDPTPSHLSPAAKEDALEEGRVKKAMMTTANLFTTSSDTQVPIPKNIDLMPVKKGVWGGKRILLSWTLSLYGSRREAVEVGIRRAGGEVLRYPGDDHDDLNTEEKEKRRDRKEARAVAECDILVTRWRNGKAYATAFRTNKTIGTLAWLYHVQSTGLMPRPVDQLLHYPVPQQPIEGFSAHEVTVTNYTGEAREYIKRLILAMGATFTPSMSGRNTVLIAAYFSGVKADKARAWSIPVVNHTWLEDCFIQWRNLTVGLEKYIVFPSGVDFSKLLGERGVGVRGVELCDEEEGREGSGSSEDDDYDDSEPGVERGKLAREGNATTTMDHGDKVLSSRVEEDIDMINMPDADPRTHRPNLNASKSSTNGKPKSIRKVSESVSPTKRSTQPSPVKHGVSTKTSASSKHVSPTKRRKLAEEEHKSSPMEAVSVEVVNVKKRKPPHAPTDANDGEDSVQQELITPSKKRDTLMPKKRKRAQNENENESDLAEVSDEELDNTPEFYKKTRAGGSGRKKVARYDGENEGSEGGEASNIRKGKRRADDEMGKKVSAAKLSSATRKTPKHNGEAKSPDASDEEQPSTPVPVKKKLLRRLRNESSSQLSLEKEKEQSKEASVSARKLVRRASGRVVVQGADGEGKGNELTEEKENISVTELGKEAPKGGLLKTTRGDARTRVKAKSATAKARELYSDSDNEVAEVAPKKTKAKVEEKGKGKASVKKATGGRKTGHVPSDKETIPVESDDEAERGPTDNRKKRSTAHQNGRVPRNEVSVVVGPPPPAAKSTPLSQKSTARGKTKSNLRATSSSDSAGDTSSAESESAPSEPAPSRLKPIASIRVEADEKGHARMSSRSRPIPSPAKLASRTEQRPSTTENAAPPPISSPLSSIRSPNTESYDVPAKRGAAAKAEQKLRVMMPDATKFEAQMKKARKSGGTGFKGIVGDWEQGQSSSGGTRKKRDSDVAEVGGEGGERRKRRVLNEKEQEESAEEDHKSDVSQQKGKGKGKDGARDGAKEKARKGNQNVAPAKGGIYVMTTQTALSDIVIKALEKLGVSMTAKPSQCTHLLAPHLVRTEKFLRALAIAPRILEATWATKSATAKELLPEDDFVLRDGAAEAKYNFKLSEALARAKKNKGKLLSQKTFYVTPKTPVDFDLLKGVVSAHGGKLVQQVPTVRIINGGANRYVVSCPADISIWRPLAAQDIPIYTHEFLLTGVLKQELEWDNPIFRVEGSQ